MFWILAAVMTAAVVSALVWPLRRAPAVLPERARYDLEVYRDQLAEVERDLARGVIAESQAEAARAEIGRRILQASSAEEPAGSALLSGRRNRLVLAALLGVVPLAALGGYLLLGRPDLATTRQQVAGQPEPASPTIEAAVAHLAERLKKEPNDPQGWELLAKSLVKLDRPDQAAEAWRQASVLLPNDTEVQGELAEALTSANRGLVSEEARQLFERVLSKEPSDPRAKHYLAEARAESGDYRGALERWQALMADSPENAPWLPMVERRIEAMAGQLGLDPVAAKPKPKPQAQNQTKATQEAKAPTAGMSPTASGDQSKAIRERVDGLAAKLKANPDDIDGWLRLAHAYEVLGEEKLQIEALAQARERAPKRVDVLVTYADAVIAQQQPAPEDGGRLPAKAAEALRAALVQAPDTPAALWYLGLEAAAGGKSAEARKLWEKLLAQLDPASSDYGDVKKRLGALK